MQSIGKHGIAFVNWVSGLSLAKRLVGVTCLSILPVAVLGGLLVTDKMRDIEFTRLEGVGLQHFETLWPVLIEHVVEGGNHKAHEAAKEEASADKRYLAIHAEQSAELGTEYSSGLVANTIENDPDLVVSAGIRHMAEIANNSNLILDPEIASIYLVLATGIELPKTLEGLSHLHRALDKIKGGTSVATPDKSEIIVGKYSTLQSAKAVISHIETVLRASNDVRLKQVLEPELKRFRDSVDQLNNTFSKAGGSQINYMLLIKTSDELENAIAAATQASDSLWKASAASLKLILEQRTGGYKTTLYATLLTFSLLLLLTSLGIFLISRSISVPISKLIANMWQLRGGDHRFETPFLERRSEIGDIARAVEASRLNAAELQKARSEIDVKLDEESSRNTDTRNFLAEISGVVRAAGDGRFENRLVITGRTGFLQELSESINSLLDNVQTGIVNTRGVVKALSKGDVSSRMDGTFKGIFLDLKQDVNQLADKLRLISGQINSSTRSVHGATKEIGAGVQDLSSRTEQQASSLEETAASMEEIAATVRQNADNAQEANQLASAARQLAVGGGDIAGRAVLAMDKIEVSSQQVGDIVGLIQEIAFQTNILALNASVEAARAGEAGRGFAVVANEVRALAQRSAQASKDIKELIAGTTANVAEGADLVKRAGTSLTDIVTSVRKVADIVSEIAAASQEQSSGIDQVSRAISNMDEMTQQNAALVEQTNAALNSAQNQIEELKQAVSFFKTGEQLKPQIEMRAEPRQAPSVEQDRPAERQAESLNLQDKLRQLAKKMLNAQKDDAPKPTRAATPSLVANADWKEF
jgi:methyl-accepting chemotaxis protein